MRSRRLWVGIVLLVVLAGCAAPQAGQPAPTAAVQNPPAAQTRAPLPTAFPTAPALSPTPTMPAGCAETHGAVEAYRLPSSHRPGELAVRIYRPPCFDPLAPAPYPVLLLLHGQSAAADQWEQLGLACAADSLLARGLIRPTIIVMPYEEDSLANPYESGYDAALVEDLLPWLTETEPAACAARECRSIGGLSRGAAWAISIGLSRPDLFGAIGAHSYPGFYGFSARLPYLLRAVPDGQMPRIWMDSGDRDRYLAQARAFDEQLTALKTPHEFHLFTGEHDATYWSRHLEVYLRWYAGSPGSDCDCRP